MQRLAAGGPEVPAARLIEALELERSGRDGLPRVVAVMIASADGRTTVAGRSTPLGHPEDRALLRGLRAAVDCVLAGTRTLAAEGYARLLDPEPRAAREAAGRPGHPLVATLSRSGRVPWDVAVFSEPGVEKQVYVGAPAPLPAAVFATQVELLPNPSPRAVLEHLAEARGIASVACEGGPRLLRALLADDLVDDVLLTVAPLLVAGDGPTVVSGPALAGPPRLVLADVHRAVDHLFLHYARAAS